MYKYFQSLLDKRNMTAGEVARLTGIPAQTLHRWRHGESVPKTDKLRILADFFNVPVEYFLTGELRSPDGYYLDDDTAQVAQKLFENADMRLLFDAARDASPEDLQMVAQLLERLKRKEKGE